MIVDGTGQCPTKSKVLRANAVKHIRRECNRSAMLFPNVRWFMDIQDNPAIPAAPEVIHASESAGDFIENVIKLCDRVLQNANTQRSSC